MVLVRRAGELCSRGVLARTYEREHREWRQPTGSDEPEHWDRYMKCGFVAPVIPHRGAAGAGISHETVGSCSSRSGLALALVPPTSAGMLGKPGTNLALAAPDPTIWGGLRRWPQHRYI